MFSIFLVKIFFMLCYLPVGFVDFFTYRYGFAFYIKVIFFLCNCVILLFKFSVLLFENKKGGLLHFGVKSPLGLKTINCFSSLFCAFFIKTLDSKTKAKATSGCYFIKITHSSNSFNTPSFGTFFNINKLFISTILSN